MSSDRKEKVNSFGRSFGGFGLAKLGESIRQQAEELGTKASVAATSVSSSETKTAPSSFQEDGARTNKPNQLAQAVTNFKKNENSIENNSITTPAGNPKTRDTVSKEELLDILQKMNKKVKALSSLRLSLTERANAAEEDKMRLLMFVKNDVLKEDADEGDGNEELNMSQLRAAWHASNEKNSTALQDLQKEYKTITLRCRDEVETVREAGNMALQSRIDGVRADAEAGAMQKGNEAWESWRTHIVEKHQQEMIALKDEIEKEHANALNAHKLDTKQQTLQEAPANIPETMDGATSITNQMDVMRAHHTEELQKVKKAAFIQLQSFKKKVAAARAAEIEKLKSASKRSAEVDQLGETDKAHELKVDELRTEIQKLESDAQVVELDHIEQKLQTNKTHGLEVNILRTQIENMSTSSTAADARTRHEETVKTQELQVNALCIEIEKMKNAASAVGAEHASRQEETARAHEPKVNALLTRIEQLKSAHADIAQQQEERCNIHHLEVGVLRTKLMRESHENLKQERECWEQQQEISKKHFEEELERTRTEEIDQFRADLDSKSTPGIIDDEDSVFNRRFVELKQSLASAISKADHEGSVFLKSQADEAILISLKAVETKLEKSVVANSSSENTDIFSKSLLARAQQVRQEISAAGEKFDSALIYLESQNKFREQMTQENENLLEGFLGDVVAQRNARNENLKTEIYGNHNEIQKELAFAKSLLTNAHERQLLTETTNNNQSQKQLELSNQYRAKEEQLKTVIAIVGAYRDTAHKNTQQKLKFLISMRRKDLAQVFEKSKDEKQTLAREDEQQRRIPRSHSCSRAELNGQLKLIRESLANASTEFKGKVRKEEEVCSKMQGLGTAAISAAENAIDVLRGSVDNREEITEILLNGISFEKVIIINRKKYKKEKGKMARRYNQRWKLHRRIEEELASTKGYLAEVKKAMSTHDQHTFSAIGETEKQLFASQAELLRKEEDLTTQSRSSQERLAQLEAKYNRNVEEIKKEHGATSVKVEEELSKVKGLLCEVTKSLLMCDQHASDVKNEAEKQFLAVKADLLRKEGELSTQSRSSQAQLDRLEAKYKYDIHETKKNHRSKSAKSKRGLLSQLNLAKQVLSNSELKHSEVIELRRKLQTTFRTLQIAIDAAAKRSKSSTEAMKLLVENTLGELAISKEQMARTSTPTSFTINRTKKQVCAEIEKRQQDQYHAVRMLVDGVNKANAEQCNLALFELDKCRQESIFGQEAMAKINANHQFQMNVVKQTLVSTNRHSIEQVERENNLEIEAIKSTYEARVQAAIKKHKSTVELMGKLKAATGTKISFMEEKHTEALEQAMQESGVNANKLRKYFETDIFSMENAKHSSLQKMVLSTDARVGMMDREQRVITDALTQQVKMMGDTLRSQFQLNLLEVGKETEDALFGFEQKDVISSDLRKELNAKVKALEIKHSIALDKGEGRRRSSIKIIRTKYSQTVDNVYKEYKDTESCIIAQASSVVDKLESYAMEQFDSMIVLQKSESGFLNQQAQTQYREVCAVLKVKVQSMEGKHSAIIAQIQGELKEKDQSFGKLVKQLKVAMAASSSMCKENDLLQGKLKSELVVQQNLQINFDKSTKELQECVSSSSNASQLLTQFQLKSEVETAGLQKNVKDLSRARDKSREEVNNLSSQLSEAKFKMDSMDEERKKRNERLQEALKKGGKLFAIETEAASLRDQINKLKLEQTKSSSLLSVLQTEKEASERKHGQRTALMGMLEEQLSDVTEAKIETKANLESAFHEISQKNEMIEITKGKLKSVEEALVEAQDARKVVNESLSISSKGIDAKKSKAAENQKKDILALQQQMARKSAAAQRMLKEKEAECVELRMVNKAIQNELDKGSLSDRRIFELAAKQSTRESIAVTEIEIRDKVVERLTEKLIARDGDLASAEHDVQQVEVQVEELCRVHRREDVNLDYLKSIVVQYLSKPPGSSERAALLPVLATLLQFDKNDYNAIDEGKKKLSWWGSVAPVLIGPTEPTQIESSAEQETLKKDAPIQGLIREQKKNSHTGSTTKVHSMGTSLQF